ALMFAVMTGPDPRDPLALPHTGEDWARIADAASIRGLRVAWTPDLGGAAAVDPGVASICRKAARVFPDLGCSLEDASPEIGNIRDPFLALNASLRLASIGKYLDQWRDQLDAIPVPCGWTESGLPIGLQIVGGWRQDALVLRAAAAFETAAPWADRRPALP